MRTVVTVQEQPIECYQAIEVLVTSTGQFRVPFPDQNQLRSLKDATVIIDTISLITTDAHTNAPISGLVVAPLTELQKISLVLYAEGWEKGLNIPLLHLNPLATPAGTIPFMNRKINFDKWANVDWSKSYLLYSGGSGGSNVGAGNYAICLAIEYQRLGVDGNPTYGPQS